jgi:hypothetical protein
MAEGILAGGHLARPGLRPPAFFAIDLARQDAPFRDHGVTAVSVGLGAAVPDLSVPGVFNAFPVDDGGAAAVSSTMGAVGVFTASAWGRTLSVSAGDA